MYGFMTVKFMWDALKVYE